jgi:HAD superfamily hydrolase (TIGR01459 family)
MTAPQLVRGLSELAPRYDGFILDQWGVLHNGSRPYPGAIEAVQALRAAGKRVALLTNSGRRTAHNQRQLVRMGFDLALFDGVVTSGEAAWLALKHGDDPRLQGLGKRAFAITRGNDQEVTADLGLELVPDPDRADFIYLTGVDSPPLTLADFEPIIQAGLARRLPMICANPDLVAVTGRGLSTAPGSVAKRYAELGGTVWYYGKPNPPIYRAVLRVLEPLPKERICAVGDSLEHDIVGANGAGIDACFIVEGIHGHELPGPDEDERLPDAVVKLARHHGGQPRYTLRRLAW